MQTTVNGIQVKFSCRPFKVDEETLHTVITDILASMDLKDKKPYDVKVLIEELVDEYIQKYIIDTWYVEDVTYVDPE